MTISVTDAAAQESQLETGSPEASTSHETASAGEITTPNEIQRVTARVWVLEGLRDIRWIEGHNRKIKGYNRRIEGIIQGLGVLGHVITGLRV